MLIDNVISLTFGVLQNTPKVRDCYEIVFNSSEVRRGDLFIVDDKEKVAEAISNGAYALLYDGDVTVNDDEIAWIKVDDINVAVTRILRHQLLEANIEIFTLETISLSIAQELSLDSRLSVLMNSSLEHIHKSIKKLSSNSILLIDKELLKTTIFPTCNFYDSVDSKSITLIESSLFQSSFLYRGSYFEQQRISPLLLPYLQTCLDFFRAMNIEFCMSKISLLKYFEPIFLNRALVMKDYGSSENVVILESNIVVAKTVLIFNFKTAVIGKTFKTICQ